MILLGEKYIISDQSVKNALNCYKILFCMGEASSSNLLYLALTYEKNFRDAIVIAKNTKSKLKEANCLINLNRRQEAL